MSDTAIPFFLIPQDGATINISIGKTATTVFSSGNTYNQAGTSFNQSGATFDGIINQNQYYPPSFTDTVLDSLAHIIISQVDTFLADQGYTYNQPGFTFNQLLVEYAGLTNQNQDIIPLFLKASQVIPEIGSIVDTYTTVSPTPPTGNSRMLIGILGMTYP